MIITTPYDYQPLTQITLDNGIRHYTNHNIPKPLPSVTTILSATKDGAFLDDWRTRMGLDEATRIVDEAVCIGSKLHKNLENYILHQSKPEGNLLVKMMTKLIIKQGLSNVTEVLGVEAPLYYPDIYAGTADLVSVVNNVLSICDFKNSARRKKEEWIEDYKLQVVAYALAHNALYGTNISQGVIMIATRECEYQEFIVSGNEFKRCTQAWWNRVYSYYEQ